MSKTTPWIALAAVLALLGGIFWVALAADPPATPATEAPPYQGRTAAEWIKALKDDPGGEARAKAAEALGFMGRENKMTYGGFSDVPIHSPEPPKLTAEALAPIAAALAAGLGDSDARVRASSAIALSWMGTRAKAALPALVRRLDDGDETTRRNVLTAIGNIGPVKNDTTARLERMLASSSGMERIHVAEAMRKAGAAPETYVPALVEYLGQEREAHYAAVELGQLGDPAVPALLKAMKEKDSTRRRYAAYAIGNMAGWKKLTKDREVVAAALVDLLRDADRKVVWHAAQAIGSVHAAPDRCVPVLIPFLADKDEQLVDRAAEALREFGKDAKSALPALLEALGRRTGRAAPVDDAIREIGVDLVTAQALSKMKIKAEVWWLLGPMLDYPAEAAEFLRANPLVVDVAVVDRDRIVEAMRSRDPRYKPVQELLFANENLPLEIVATLGEPRFLPLLENRAKKANAYAKTHLAACMRACGSPVKEIVKIGESKPGDFKPTSAWPGSNKKRWAPNSMGHGDGITSLIVTGRIVRSDGKPLAAPKFYRVNDSFLLGERQKEAEPIVFEPKTGRFVFLTQVFAAYSVGEGQEEEGPYQTGSSQVLIEAEGCKPLEVQFYDEMPDVEITLSPRAD